MHDESVVQPADAATSKHVPIWLDEVSVSLPSKGQGFRCTALTPAYHEQVKEFLLLSSASTAAMRTAVVISVALLSLACTVAGRAQFYQDAAFLELVSPGIVDKGHLAAVSSQCSCNHLGKISG